MKILVLVYFFLFSLNLSSQVLRDSILVKTPAYEVIYSEKLEQPRRLSYSITCIAGDISRAGMDFYLNDSIKTSDDLDYINNVYDKGHLAPAADFDCDSNMLWLSFSYLNCALQHQSLNRGVWKSLESYERDMVLEDDVFVTIEVIFSDTSKVLPTGATIPDGFRKTIKTKNTGKTYVYYFPNKYPEMKNFSEYLLVNKKKKEKPKKVGYIKNK